MRKRILIADPKKCTGCQLCELACALQQAAPANPAQPRINIVNWQDSGFFLPVMCQHCDDPPCMDVCPREAIYRDDRLGHVTVNYDLCVSCQKCAAVCPFGAIGFDPDYARVYKCDLCLGEPQCVKYCPYQALAFVSADALAYPRLRLSAQRIAPNHLKHGN
jgi:Fe-S-cluster-containing hydrogenase component 2